MNQFPYIFYTNNYGNKIVGFASYYMLLKPTFNGIKKDLILFSIAVDPEYRGCGYGERLLFKSIDEIGKNLCNSVSLCVRTTNIPALSLYNKAGFKVIKEVPNMYEKEESGYHMILNF